jgi:CheY-like chemotaxis protein
MASELKPEAITLDLVMPILDGWGFLERAQLDPELSRIPVVVVSVAQDLDHSQTLGAVGAISKPINREMLLETLTQSGVAQAEAAQPAQPVLESGGQPEHTTQGSDRQDGNTSTSKRVGA